MKFISWRYIYLNLWEHQFTFNPIMDVILYVQVMIIWANSLV